MVGDALGGKRRTLNLVGLRSELARIKLSLPAHASSDDGAAARNAGRLASIAGTPEGPRRDVVVTLMVHSASGIEEPGDYQALVEAIGHEAIERAFPVGIPAQRACAFVRSRARAWQRPTGFASPLEAMVHDQLAKERAAREMAAAEAVSS
jgi:hypothetical protein